MKNIPNQCHAIEKHQIIGLQIARVIQHLTPDQIRCARYSHWSVLSKPVKQTLNLTKSNLFRLQTLTFHLIKKQLH